LPHIIPIHEPEWEKQNPPFDKYTALRIGISDASTSNGNGEGEEAQDVYDFKINMDNIFLKTELKGVGQEVEVTNDQWKYGLVLTGLALLHDDAQSKKVKEPESEGSQNDEENGEGIEKRVEIFTRAIAPVLLPMITSLGSLDADAPVISVEAGEST
jgi:hypothetical protein